MGIPRVTASATNTSVGFTSRMVTITAITPDGKTAVAVDKQGTEVRVSMQIQPAKGIPPAPGEQWIVKQDLTNTWTFAAIATNDAEVFTNPQVAGTGPLDIEIPPPAPGSIPGSAIAPGTITGTEISPTTITNLQLSAQAAATNIILDPQFTSSGVNAVRQADPGTACTWTFATPNVSVAGGLAVCTLALMPSTLVPLYVNPGEQYYVSTGVTLPAGAPGGITAGIQFAYNDGSFGGPLLPVAAGSQTVAQLTTIPAGVASAYVRLIIAGLPSGVTATFTAPTCYITQGPNQLQPGSVGSANLQANSVYANAIQAGAVTANALHSNSVDASKIVANTIDVAQLKVGIVVAGIVDSTVVTGATLQNNTGNPKTSINPDGSITITNAAGIVIFRIGPDGTVYWYDQSGVLTQQINPGGTQLVYQSLTGPVQVGFEPPSPPTVIMALFNAVSATTIVNPVSTPSLAGDVLTVIVSASGATDCTTVTDTQNNTYTLVQSCTAVSPHMQVFQAVTGPGGTGPTRALGGTDSFTMTMSAANTQQKNFIALASSKLLAVSPLDFSAKATGTSTAPSVTGTPGAFGELVLFIASWASAGGAGTVPDGWLLAQQSQVSGQQYTSVWFRANVTTSALTASATITSAAWSAVMVAYKDAAPQGVPVPTNATLTASTQWGDDGNFSARVTKVGTASTWGITFPSFPVQPKANMTARIVFGTLNIALPAAEIGFTWWSGPNGTGTNLGSAIWDIGASWGTIPFNSFQAFVLYNCIVPATAQSATFYAIEKQADTAGQWFLIDNLQVPGGLVYSNSPFPTTDALGNQVDQGINFVGLPSTTNVLGVEDPFGNQLASIDATGGISGQVVNANTDVVIGGQSLLTDILPNYSLGVVTRGWVSTAGNWPSTPLGATETPLLELDYTIPVGRAYMLQVLPANFIPTVSADTQLVMRLRYTQDGSTPSTSSTQVSNHSPAISPVPASLSGKNIPSPYMEWLNSIPATVPAPFRVLLTAQIQSGSCQFVTQNTVLEMRVTDIGNNTVDNNGVVLGSGSGGGSTPQTYTEHFYGNNTWTYNEYGLRNTNGTIYQGAYSGEGFAQYCYIQWSMGDLGNPLNTVLNYTVKKVSLRLLNQHSWYNSGMTVSWHASTALGSTGGPLTSELASWHTAEGVYMETVFGLASMWAPFKAGGVTYGVLRPPSGSLSLNYYGYFWGGGNNNGNVPRLTVTYVH